ncbi:MAG: ferrous iron transport protein B [Asgard group archaeon]|nr:ferrous iron transport protein B [Asgard group archaeon]
MKIALAGNPNVGKSVIFNALTGSHQHVANFPGCTVEHKEGKCVFGEKTLTILDLPGTYSLSAYSEDERVSRHFLITERPDLVINIIDASNLERNLYLTVQLQELGLPIIIVLNMIDLAKSKGFEIDINALKNKLNLPVIPMIATKGKGTIDLLNLILNYDIANTKTSTGFNQNQKCIKKYEDKLTEILEQIDEQGQLKRFNYHWLGLKLLEQDSLVLDLINQIIFEKAASNEKYNTLYLKGIDQLIHSFKDELNIEDTAVYITNERYKLIMDIISSTLIKRGKASTNLTSMLDDVLTDKYFGIPIFVVSLWAIFTFTFTLSEPFVFMLEGFFSLLTEIINKIVINQSIAGLMIGIINGLGAILVFIPNIFLLYFALAVFEDSGYLSRAAFIVDKWLEKIGLHGKSFIPLMLGFGCTVPAIMATRSIRNKADRMITLSIAPFISCSARLPVYVLFAGIFFPDHASLVILLMYIIGIIVGIITAKILNTRFYQHEDHGFILELPEFQKPQLKTALKEMWLQGSHFIKKAGTIIFLASFLVWIMSNIPFGASLDNTILAFIGKFIEPLFSPFGWKWEFISALLLGLLAKEVVVATLGILGGSNFYEFISTAMTINQAFSYMVFILLYTPCIATLAVIKSETGSWRTTLFLGLGYIFVAYTIALFFKMILILIGFS